MWISSRFFVILLLLNLGRCHHQLFSGKTLKPACRHFRRLFLVFPKSLGTRRKVLLCLVLFVFPAPAVCVRFSNHKPQQLSACYFSLFVTRLTPPKRNLLLSLASKTKGFGGFCGILLAA